MVIENKSNILEALYNSFKGNSIQQSTQFLESMCNSEGYAQVLFTLLGENYDQLNAYDAESIKHAALIQLKNLVLN